MTKCAIWARVSTTDQDAGTQLGILRDWASRRGLEVVTEYVTEDSAFHAGPAFDKARAELLNGARLGRYSVVLTWALDRLSRKGVEDTLAVLRKLYGHDCDVWSHQESWLETSSPEMRELLVSLFAWIAGQESRRRSERMKASIAKRKAEGKPIGRGHAKDAKPRRRAGYLAAWSPDGARRLAQPR